MVHAVYETNGSKYRSAGGAAGAAGCVEGLCSLRSGGEKKGSEGSKGCGIALTGDEYIAGVTRFPAGHSHSERQRRILVHDAYETNGSKYRSAGGGAAGAAGCIEGLTALRAEGS